ncbi:MAG: hypothetical protein IJY92_06060 [Alphaproteobacteria bacterium]|nr:hypothetical protein [Alphaproteobacteria bacterium]
MKFFLLIGSFFLLSACAQFEPFVDERREAGQIETVGSSKPGSPVVCSGFWTTKEERFLLAQAECEKMGKIAQSKSIHSFECKLFAPVKETFVCVSKE